MKKYGLWWALGVGVFVILPAHADEYCPIHPPKGATGAQLAALARITEPVARQVALNQLHSRGEKTVRSARLEVDQDCLVWSFEVTVAGEPGIQAIQLDADTGRVISVRQKSTSGSAAARSRTSR